jgi:alpha-ketoglutarate-dependent taurine dioxygenase
MPAHYAMANHASCPTLAPVAVRPTVGVTGDARPTGQLFGALRLLCAQARLPEYQCRFRWEPDSITFWDNRSTQHYAISDYWPEARVMERVTIAGDRPV